MMMVKAVEMISKPSKYETSKPAVPVFFVDPATGDVLELDLKTVEFTKKGSK
jgi:hypothetical protein